MLNSYTKLRWFKSIFLILIFGLLLGLISKALFNPSRGHPALIKTYNLKTATINIGDHKDDKHYRVRAE